MYLAHDSVGIWILPVFSELGQSAWELVSGLNLIFLPLVFVMFKVVFQSRAQGADEGNAAVLAYKHVEKAAFWYLFVFVLFLIPTSPQPVVSNNYSCFANVSEGGGDWDTGVDHFTSQVEVPLGFGVVNNLSHTFFGTLRGKMSCGDSARLVVDANESRMNARSNPPLQNRIELFNQSCMRPAMERLESMPPQDIDALGEGYNLSGSGQMRFSGSAMSKIYRGTHTVPSLPTIKAELDKSHWPDTYDMDGVLQVARNGGYTGGYGSMNSTETKYNVECESFALNLENEIYEYLDDRYTDEFAQAVAAGGYRPGVTDVDAARKEAGSVYIQRFFDNSVIMVAGGNTVQHHASQSGQITYSDVSGFGGLSEAEMQVLGAANDKHKEDYFAQMGFFLTTFMDYFKSTLESYTIFLYLSLVLVFAQGMVLALTPIALTVGGFSLPMILSLTVLPFYFAGLGYLFEVAYVITSTMRSITSSAYGGDQVNMDIAAAVISTFTLLGSLSLWTGVCVAIGMRFGPVVESLIGGFAAVGAAANSYGKDLVKRVGSVGLKGK
ncbi:conjugal transfer protein TraG N-terminal domain-containing protein [Vibrio owensii]|uniref:conjugal transfer protein TraG N-terminal domain-containing protein n=1 Tax=Vibrio owensii TaxID=696485 RepID=UPI0018F13123|nr:conjugal transfer protein TraG N-terminal domain-containing protein [Vibrio owensii]